MASRRVLGRWKAGLMSSTPTRKRLLLGLDYDGDQVGFGLKCPFVQKRLHECRLVGVLEV